MDLDCLLAPLSSLPDRRQKASVLCSLLLLSIASIGPVAGHAWRPTHVNPDPPWPEQEECEFKVSSGCPVRPFLKDRTKQTKWPGAQAKMKTRSHSPFPFSVPLSALLSNPSARLVESTRKCFSKPPTGFWFHLHHCHPRYHHPFLSPCYLLSLQLTTCSLSGGPHHLPKKFLKKIKKKKKGTALS